MMGPSDVRRGASGVEQGITTGWMMESVSIIHASGLNVNQGAGHYSMCCLLPPLEDDGAAGREAA